MTWEIKDLRRQRPPEESPLPPPEPTPEQLPRHALAARFTLADETFIPAEVRREMVQAGLVDEETWLSWRRLMTRGVYEL
jgi:hypothetical protein